MVSPLADPFFLKDIRSNTVIISSEGSFIWHSKGFYSLTHLFNTSVQRSLGLVLRYNTGRHEDMACRLRNKEEETEKAVLAPLFVTWVHVAIKLLLDVLVSDT